MRRKRLFTALAIVLPVGLALAAPARANFVTFESGQVRPLALSDDGAQLFAVNTPDNRVEVFDVDGATLTRAGSVPVGMEPVAIAIRPGTSEVWVVNHLSDSVSIIDGAATPPRVVRTLLVGDEPRDIVFAGPGGSRAFITTAHRGQNTPFHDTIETILRAEGTGRADVWVFDGDDLGATLEGEPLTIVNLFGDTPRALAVSPDGNTVYAAVFHSGNQTAAISEGAVCNGGAAAGPCGIDGITVPGGLPGGQVPGGLPAPNQNLDGDPAPEVGLIVKFNNSNGHWEDQATPTKRNWTNAVRFNLPDLDVFAIDADAATPVETDSFAHVGTVLFNMVTNPMNGRVYVSNTDARNEVRFEGPGGGGSTVRGHLHEARITVIDGSTVTPRHLNKHITAEPQGYRTVPMGADVNGKSLATPMGMAVSNDGTKLYVAAFGSSKVGVFNTAQLESDAFTPGTGHITVTGGGPSGLVLDSSNAFLYVFTRFDNSISVINTGTNLEVGHVSVYNPEPPQVVNGRRFLYDAKFTSSNGEASCSSCHIFGDFDSLGWDLGNPDDIQVSNPNPPSVVFTGVPFHPMKGPMTTQTLRGMATHGPMHWRGDRTGAFAAPNIPPDSGGFDEEAAFMAFNVAFEGLLGRDEGMLSSDDMQAFTNFILEVMLPPNPIRELTNELTDVQQDGADFYFGPISDIVADCNGCHAVDANQGFFGADGRTSFEGETQEFKVPHLRNLYQKVGMFGQPDFGAFVSGTGAHTGNQVRGFGFLHDGSVDTLFRFHSASLFDFPGGDPQRREVESFMFAFDTDFAPIVGQQTTLTNSNGATVDARLDLLLESAEDPFVLRGLPGAHECDLIVKGVVSGEERGFLYNPSIDRFQSDRAAEPVLTDAQLRALVDTATEALTYTCAPPGSGTRMGIDRDEDGALDRDEIDAGSDPANPNSLPAPPQCGEIPQTGCNTAGKSLLLIKYKEGKEKINWKWNKGQQAVDANELGDPTTDTAYALCIYAGTAVTEINAPPGGSWAAAGFGFKYKDKSGAVDGVQNVLVKAGDVGKPKVLVKAKGPNAPIPVGLSDPVLVQFTNSVGECWEATYDGSAIIKNDETQFKAKF